MEPDGNSVHAVQHQITEVFQVVGYDDPSKKFDQWVKAKIQTSWEHGGGRCSGGGRIAWGKNREEMEKAMRMRQQSEPKNSALGRTEGVDWTR